LSCRNWQDRLDCCHSIQYLLKCSFSLARGRSRHFTTCAACSLMHHRCLCILNSLSCISGFIIHISLDPFLILFIVQQVDCSPFLPWYFLLGL
jgi:hypothetical protein